MSQSNNQARPSEEIKSVTKFFVSDPDLNVAIQVGGLDLGPIASHIVTTYWRYKHKMGATEDLTKLTAREKKVYAAFKLFVEKKLPMLAAQYGPPTSDRLIEAYIQTTRSSVILASGLKTDISGLVNEATKGDGTTTTNADKK